MHGYDDEDENAEEILYQEGAAFQGAAVVALVHEESEETSDGGAEAASDRRRHLKPLAMEITMEDGVLLTVDLDSGEKRLVELGYKQDLRRALVSSVVVTANAVIACQRESDMPMLNITMGNAHCQ